MRISGINNQNSNKYNIQPNFKSQIKVTDFHSFWKEYAKFPMGIDFVDFPWTPNEIKKSKMIITQGIKTCTAGGIITKSANGERDVVMFHLNPDQEACKDFDYIRKTFIEKIGNSKPIQALMVGSKDENSWLKYSGEYFDNLYKNVIKAFEIPTSFLKGIPMGGKEVDLLYNAPEDMWLISNTTLDAYPKFAEIRKTLTGFKEVSLSKLDSLELI